VTTIHDVARAAGVSTATVSRVVNGRGDVTPALAERVAAVVAELGYAPSAGARNLRMQTASVWALVISDVESSYFTSLVRAVEGAARARGFSVAVYNSDDDPEQEARHLRVALAERVAGVILSPARPDADVRPLLDRGIPVVTVDRRLDGAAVSAVVADNVDAGRRATEHLLAGGARRIASITGPLHVSTAAERREGYREALATAGLPLDPQLDRSASYREEGGELEMRALLALPDPPDAVVTANGLLTVGALRALHDAGRRVPTDIGLVGFDDNPWLAVTDPPLTVVRQPTEELGRRAAELLIATPEEPVTVVLPTELIMRGSTRRPSEP